MGRLGGEEALGKVAMMLLRHLEWMTTSSLISSPRSARHQGFARRACYQQIGAIIVARGAS